MLTYDGKERKSLDAAFLQHRQCQTITENPTLRMFDLFQKGDGARSDIVIYSPHRRN